MRVLRGDAPDATHAALRDVAEEVNEQIAKWGQQDPPSFCRDGLAQHGGRFGYGLPFAGEQLPSVVVANIMREACQARFRIGEGAWADIALEEIAEAFAESGDPTALYTELVQCAAVFVSWAASVQRNEIER